MRGGTCEEGNAGGNKCPVEDRPEGKEGREGRDGGWGGGMGMDMRVCYCGEEGGGGTVLRKVERSNTW